MDNVRYVAREGGKGKFIVQEGDETIGQMTVETRGSTLTVYHTVVEEEWEGQGIAKGLLDTMAQYARQHKLKVNPICEYVAAQFKRHPDQYTDIS